MRKSVRWLGNSLDELLKFPQKAQQKLGTDLSAVQNGITPSNIKPFIQIGAGVYELRAEVANSHYRTFYVAKHDDFVYVLHCFYKNTQQTDQRDVDLGKQRYREMLQEIQK